MDKKMLEQYGSIKREVEELRKDRTDLLASAKEVPVVDTVSSSSRHMPYGKHTVVIKGTAVVMSRKKAAKLKETETRLAEREMRLHNEYAEIEKFIDSIEKSKIRRIIEYKYVNGLSWTATASKVYGCPKENRARMAVTRYLEKKQKKFSKSANCANQI